MPKKLENKIAVITGATSGMALNYSSMKARTSLSPAAAKIAVITGATSGMALNYSSMKARTSLSPAAAKKC